MPICDSAQGPTLAFSYRDGGWGCWDLEEYENQPICLSVHVLSPQLLLSRLMGFDETLLTQISFRFLHFQREIAAFLIKKRAGFHFVSVHTVPPIPFIWYPIQNQSVNARWRGNALLIVSTINIRHDLFSLFFYILIHDYFKSVHILHIAYWGSDCTWQFVAVHIP